MKENQEVQQLVRAKLERDGARLGPDIHCRLFGQSDCQEWYFLYVHLTFTHNPASLQVCDIIIPLMYTFLCRHTINYIDLELSMENLCYLSILSAPAGDRAALLLSGANEKNIVKSILRPESTLARCWALNTHES